MRWLGLHFPNLGLEVFTPATIEQSLEAPKVLPGVLPGVLGAPQVSRVLPRILVEDNRVVLGNDAARQAGIALGSTLATATSIAPELLHRVRDPDREIERLHEIAAALYRLSDHVSLAPPDGLILEVSGSLRLFGGLRSLEQQALTITGELGHTARHRTATTPLAALLLARAGQDQVAAVPLSQCGLPEVQVERLGNMGIHHLGPLLALPPRALGHRFGTELTDFLARLSGLRPDPRAAVVPSAQFSRSLNLLEAINDKEVVGFPMQRLASELEHWLIGRQLGAERLRWRFAPQLDSRACELTVRFARAQQRKSALMSISRLRLDAAELPDDVMNLTLTAERLVPWVRASQELFQPFSGRSGQGAVDPSEILDQLRARLGDRACHGIRSTRQHAPEWAWRKAAPRTGKRLRKTDSGPDLRRTPRRPLWLFDPPRLTERRMLTLLRGPERIQTGWWRRTLNRDYYVARHRSGAECWAFVDQRERWYLHGYFA